MNEDFSMENEEFDAYDEGDTISEERDFHTTIDSEDWSPAVKRTQASSGEIGTLGWIYDVYESSARAFARLTKEEEQSLARKIAQGDRAAYETMMCANLPLVIRCAKKYRGCGIDFMDLIQEGNFGLSHAIEKFDPDRGFRFSTYAMWWIKDAIVRELSRHSRTVALPHRVIARGIKVKRIRERLLSLGLAASTETIAQQCEYDEHTIKEAIDVFQMPISLDAPISCDDERPVSEVLLLDHQDDSVIAGSVQRDIVKIAHEVVAELSGCEWHIMCLLFGLYDDNPQTLVSVAALYDMKVPTLSRRVNIIKERMKNALIAKGYRADMIL